MIGLVILLIVAGVLLALVNKYGSPWIDGAILKIINVVVIIGVILYVLHAFGVFGAADVPVPQVR